MNAFKKRTYSSIGPFLSDLRSLWAQRRYFKLPMGIKGIDAAFRERLFLAETEVNGCHYCSFVHSRAAVKEGVPADEVRELLSREWGHVPERERPAVAYAQHWADTYGNPDPSAIATLESTYGPDAAASIHFTLLLMKVSNYLGNFVDLCLFKLSFGRLGA